MQEQWRRGRQQQGVASAEQQDAEQPVPGQLVRTANAEPTADGEQGRRDDGASPDLLHEGPGEKPADRRHDARGEQEAQRHGGRGRGLNIYV